MLGVVVRERSQAHGKPFPAVRVGDDFRPVVTVGDSRSEACAGSGIERAWAVPTHDPSAADPRTPARLRAWPGGGRGGGWDCFRFLRPLAVELCNLQSFALLFLFLHI